MFSCLVPKEQSLIKFDYRSSALTTDKWGGLNQIITVNSVALTGCPRFFENENKTFIMPL